MAKFPKITENTETVIRGLEARFPARFPLRSDDRNGKPLLVAIDGRCGSGKTTLGLALQAELRERFGVPVNLFHMDDFYLRPEQRTPERYAEPGGNVDRERFLREVLEPLCKGKTFYYHPFSWHLGGYLEPVEVHKTPVSVIEGSFSCHPELMPFYDLTVFLTLDPAEQRRRLLLREGEEKFRQFIEKWIPLEELYFTGCDTANRCELVFDMTRREE